MIMIFRFTVSKFKKPRTFERRMVKKRPWNVWLLFWKWRRGQERRQGIPELFRLWYWSQKRKKRRTTWVPPLLGVKHKTGQWATRDNCPQGNRACTPRHHSIGRASLSSFPVNRLEFLPDPVEQYLHPENQAIQLENLSNSRIPTSSFPFLAPKR